MYLAVEMPPLQTRERTRSRLGRSVAALFGIPGERRDGDAGAGRAWLTDFPHLTLTELLLGGPRTMKAAELEAAVHDTGVFDSAQGALAPTVIAEPRRGYGELAPTPISQAVIAEYGPEPRAAGVLVGTNYVLEPLTQALITVLTEIAWPDVRMLTGTTAMLLAEAFRSQPLLLLGGVQASRIQAALSLSDTVQVLVDDPTPDTPWRTSRLDLPWTQRERRRRRHSQRRELRPDRLDLIDDVWMALIAQNQPVKLVPQSTNIRTIEQPTETSQINRSLESALSAARVLTERVIFGLGDDAIRTRTVIRRRPDGTFYTDFPGVATRPARIVVDRLVGRYFNSLPPGASQVQPGQNTVPGLDPGRWEYETGLVKRVALWAHHCAERFAVSGAWNEAEPHNSSFAMRTRQRNLLADTAESFFGATDPMTLELQLFARSYDMELASREYSNAIRKGLQEPKQKLDPLVAKFERTADALIALRDDANTDKAVMNENAAKPKAPDKPKPKPIYDSHLLEALQATLMDLRAVCPVADPELRTQIVGMLKRYCYTYLQVQISLVAPPSLATQDPDQLLRDLAAPGAPDREELAAILESCQGLTLSMAEFAGIDLAIAVQRNVSERRKTVYGFELDWPPYRQVLVDQAQLLIRRFLDRGNSHPRAKDLEEIRELVDQIVKEELLFHDKEAELRKETEVLERLAEEVDGFATEDHILATLAAFLTLDLAKRHREAGGLSCAIRQSLEQLPRRLLTHRIDGAKWSEDPRLKDKRDALNELLERRN